MGYKEDWFKDFAIALAKDAGNELGRAEERLRQNDYAYAVFHSQQCAEKIAKALLEMEHVIHREHYVADLFEKEVASKHKGLLALAELMRWFEIDKKWSISRYPIKVGGRVKLPDEMFTMDVAKKAVKNARTIFDNLKKALKDKYGVEI